MYKNKISREIGGCGMFVFMFHTPSKARMFSYGIKWLWIQTLSTGVVTPSQGKHETRSVLNILNPNMLGHIGIQVSISQ